MNNQTSSLSQLLKENSRQTHDAVDELVMSMEPFATKENYGKFLQAQHEFHETLRSMYVDDRLNQQIANLHELGRADRVLKDMEYLNTKSPDIDIKRPIPTGINRIGWLYCAEGSNVGAAFLYKAAGKIELNDMQGASHLAAHSDGRLRHWKEFKMKLDALELSENEKTEVLKGVKEAFAYFKDVLKSVYA